MIVLSDVTPNEYGEVSLSRAGTGLCGRRGDRERRKEVRAVCASGVTALCVYTGDDAGLPAVQRFSGKIL